MTPSRSEVTVTAKSSPSMSTESLKSKSTGRFEYTWASGTGESRMSNGADSDTIISIWSETGPLPSSRVSVMV